MVRAGQAAGCVRRVGASPSAAEPWGPGPGRLVAPVQGVSERTRTGRRGSSEPLVSSLLPGTGALEEVCKVGGDSSSPWFCSASSQDVLGWSASLAVSQGPHCRARPRGTLCSWFSLRGLTPSRRQVWVGAFCFSVSFQAALFFLKRRTWGGEGEKGRCSARNVPVERTQGAQDSWQLVPQEVSPCRPA